MCEQPHGYVSMNYGDCPHDGLLPSFISYNKNYMFV